MTERSPAMPCPLNIGGNNSLNVKPNPRTVRASDMTWFNTRGNKIIKTDYNTCNGNIDTHMFPWGILPEHTNIPFNLKAWGDNSNNGKCDLFKRFDMYGLSSTCTNKCSKSGKLYVNPN
jgi:hypothetical protein